MLPQTEQALRVKPLCLIRPICKTIEQTIPISHILESEILEKLLSVRAAVNYMAAMQNKLREAF